MICNGGGGDGRSSSGDMMMLGAFNVCELFIFDDGSSVPCWVTCR